MSNDEPPAQSRVRRDHRHTTRYSDEEWATRTALAHNLGVTVSDLDRLLVEVGTRAFERALERAAQRKATDEALLRQAIDVLAEHTKAFNEATKQLRACGYHQMQLARHANSQNQVPAEALGAVGHETKQVARALEALAGYGRAIVRRAFPW